MTSRLITDRYSVLEPLGSGSFGKVFKVKDRASEKIYACKEINYGRMSEKEKELLVSEVNILRELRNPQIVRYIDRVLDKTLTKLYIIMEYCGGGDLAGYIRRHRTERRFIKEEVIWNVFIQALSALHSCHTHKPDKVLHRDIKPGNILLDSQQRIKMGDFGLSRTLEVGKAARTTVGTPLYMSPEQYDKRSYDEKCDIWSLGCVVYEMASLKPPFEASTHDALARRVRQGRFVPIPSHYSADLKNLIDEMLSLSPLRRPSTTDLMKIPRVSLCHAELQFQTQYSEYKTEKEKTVAREKTVEVREAELVAREKEIERRERELEVRERALAVRLAQLDQR